ncbi:MAG: hypothetical protein RQ867_00400 [Mariprofundaceae bacterium]|nr:hypothetical protein [Mariprofundaceae bacterium]
MSVAAYSGLSLDQAPPLSVPLRFFLTAPLFGIAASVLMLVSGPEMFTGRWSPSMFALTHLITLGFISMVMIGAVQQLLPVLVGAPVKKPVLIGTILHGLMMLGVPLLVTGFLLEQQWLLSAAFLILAVCFTLFLAVTLYCLFTAESKSDSVTAMRLSVISLAIAVAVGICAGSGLTADAAGFAWAAGVVWGDIHLGWALFGWVGLMFIGVGFQVVPMFQLTPAYPKAVMHRLPGVIFGLLLICSFTVLTRPELAAWLMTVVVFCFVLFAVVTLSLQSRRRRRTPDVTLDYWRLGMASILAAALLWLIRLLLPDPTLSPALELATGIIVLVGVMISLIIGMIYKIVPFLLWFHLQSRLDEYVKLPTMKQMLPDHPARRQLRLHTAALLFLTATAIWPSGWTLYPAALLFAVSSLLLWLNIFNALKHYRNSCAMLDGLGNMDG